MNGKFCVSRQQYCMLTINLKLKIKNLKLLINN